MKRILSWIVLALVLVAVVVLYNVYAPKHRFNVPSNVEQQIDKAMRR